MRPFFPYFGSAFNKAKKYPAPVYDEVWEVFAGSAGYSTFYACPRVHLIDADPIIVGTWDFLMKSSPAEIMALPELPNTGDSVDDHPLPQEAKWLIGWWLNRGSAQPKKSRTAYSARSDRGQLNWGPRAKERIASQLRLIEGWTVQHGDYSEAPNGEHVTFVDPPYVDKGRYYRVGFNDHAGLGDWSRGRSGQVIVCEGVGHGNWLPFRPLGSFKTSLGRADEFVWTNDCTDLFAEAA